MLAQGAIQGGDLIALRQLKWKCSTPRISVVFQLVGCDWKFSQPVFTGSWAFV